MNNSSQPEKRNRFSGTLSIKNMWSQLTASFNFWVQVAGFGSLALLVTGWGAVFILNSANGLSTLFIRYEVYRLFMWLGVPPVHVQRAMPDWFFDLVKNDVDRVAVILGQIHQIEREMGWVFLASLIAFPLIMFAGSYWAKREEDLLTADRYIRGARRVDKDRLNEELEERDGAGDIDIGGVRLPRSLETQNIFLVGRPNQGKTQIALSVADTVCQRGDRGVFWTLKGEDFLCTHYRPGDHIFCPVDDRTVRWTIFNDIKSETDFDLIGEAIVPDDEKVKTWTGGARALVVGLMRYCYLNGRRTNKDLWEVLSSSMETMHKYLAATPGCERAAGLISNPKSQTAFSFYVTLMLYVKPLELLARCDGDFSINEWAEREGSGSNLFIISTQRMKQPLQTVHTVFLEMLFTAHLSLPDKRDRRIWYFLDELPALNKIRRLPELMNTGRSKGACVIVGTQAFVGLDRVYGREDRQTVFNACCTTVMFSVNDSDTARDLSRHIGEQEIDRSKQNVSISFNDMRDTVTVLQDKQMEKLYLPETIMDLPAMTCVLKILGYPVSELNLTYKAREKRCPEFVLNPAFSLETYLSQYSRCAADVEQLAAGTYTLEEEQKKQQEQQLRASLQEESDLVIQQG